MEHAEYLGYKLSILGKFTDELYKFLLKKFPEDLQNLSEINDITEERLKNLEKMTSFYDRD